MTRLLTRRYELPASAPRVSIIIPAKDEAAGIHACVAGCLNQSYPNFDVVAIDDRSADGTAAILDEMAANSGRRMRVMHVRPAELPDGWLGKCNALHRATRDKSSDWILFVDSDVTLEPSALRDAMALAVARRYDALSLLTRLECHSLLEELTLPLLAATWAVTFTVSLTNDDNRPHIAAANGQFFLIRREAYDIVDGHAAVRDQIVEDVELARLLKGRGFRVRLMLGSHLAATRMHATMSQILNGWGRIFAGTARRSTKRIVLAIALIVLSGLSAYPALIWGLVDAFVARRFAWLASSLAHLALLTVYLSVVYRGSGNRARMSLLFPAAAVVLLRVLGFTLKLCRTGRVNWRGSEFHAGAPPTAPQAH
jgi:glycosyltransferase involved in cell wall biosynthesis